MIVIINFLIFIFTTGIISYWLYLRINRKIYIIVLATDVEKYYNYLFNLLLLTIIILLLFLSAIIIKKILHYIMNKLKKEGKKEKKIQEKIIKLYNFIVNKVNIFYKTYTIIYNFIGADYTQKLLFLAKRLLDLTQNTNRNIILLFVMLPRVIILITLITEILIGTLHYYFYTLLLLLVPLLFKLLIFVFKDLGPRVLPEIKQIVIQQNVNDAPELEIRTPDGIKKVKAVRLTIHPDFSDIDPNFIFYNYYYPAIQIEGHMEVNISPLYSKITKISLYLYYGIHLLGLSYILYIYA